MKWLPVFLFFLFCAAGLSEFHLWPQVTYLWKLDARLSDLLLHPHGMRYLLVLPYFVVGKWLNVSHDWLFSITVPSLIAIIAMSVVSSVDRLNRGLGKNDASILFFIVCTLLILLSGFMNGRILFSITGSSILLYVFVRWDEKRPVNIIFLVLSAFLFSSVSSGTFFVAVLSFYVFFVAKCIYITGRSGKNYMLFPIFIGILLAAIPLLKVLLIKNISYYGGGVDGLINMLSHGFGVIFLSIDIELLVLVLLILTISVLLLFLLIPAYKNILIPIYLIGASLTGGMFGTSTMMMLVPPVLVIVCLAILKISKYTLLSRPPISGS